MPSTVHAEAARLRHDSVRGTVPGGSPPVPWKEPTLFHVGAVAGDPCACNPAVPQEALAVRRDTTEVYCPINFRGCPLTSEVFSDMPMPATGLEIEADG